MVLHDVVIRHGQKLTVEVKTSSPNNGLKIDSNRLKECLSQSEYENSLLYKQSQAKLDMKN